MHVVASAASLQSGSIIAAIWQMHAKYCMQLEKRMIWLSIGSTLRLQLSIAYILVADTAHPWQQHDSRAKPALEPLNGSVQFLIHGWQSK